MKPAAHEPKSADALSMALAAVPNELIALSESRATVGERYRLLKLLGRGGMGLVFEAVDRDGRRFAIKFAADVVKARERLAVRFEREAEILRQLSSEHVVRVHAVGQL